MRKKFVWLLLGAAALLGMLVFVLGPPLFMDRVMDRSVGQTQQFALAEGEPMPSVPADAGATLPPMVAMEEDPISTLGLVPLDEPLPTTALLGDIGELPVLSPVPILASPSPTIQPFPTATMQVSMASPSTEVDLPWMMAPTPSPLAFTDGASLQPAAWRDLLTRESQDKMVTFDKARANWFNFSNLESFDPGTTQYYGIADGRLLLENLVPLTPAQQKLVIALRGNVDNRLVFIPESNTLNNLMSLEISSAILSPSGAASSLTLPLGASFPLPVFRRYLEETGVDSQLGGTMTKEEYASFLGQMQAEAWSQVEGNAVAAMDQSRQLVSKQMWGDSPLSLTIVRMEAYVFEQDWEYVVAGHHVLCLDMNSGNLYTLTTDLLSDSVIGIATEDAEPFLKTYAGLVEKARDILSPASEEDGDAVYAQMSGLLSKLADTAFTQDEWSMEFGQGGNEGGVVWTLEGKPVDADARMVDPLGGIVPVYTLMLGESLELERYTLDYQPTYNMSGRSYPLEAAEGFLEYVDSLAMPDNVKQRITFAVNNVDTMEEKLLSRLNLAGLALSSTTRSKTLNLKDYERSLGGEHFYSMMVSSWVSDAQGRAYVLSYGPGPGGDIVLRSLTRDRPLDGAIGLPGVFTQSTDMEYPYVDVRTEETEKKLLEMLDLLTGQTISKEAWNLQLYRNATKEGMVTTLMADAKGKFDGPSITLATYEDMHILQFGYWLPESTASPSPNDWAYEKLSKYVEDNQRAIVSLALGRLQGMQGEWSLVKLGQVSQWTADAYALENGAPTNTIVINAEVRDGLGHTYGLQLEVFSEEKSRILGLQLLADGVPVSP